MADWEEAPSSRGPRSGAGGGWEEAPRTAAPRQASRQGSLPQGRAPAPTGAMEMPSYDPMGMPTGATTMALTGPAMPYGEQMSNVGRVAQAAGQGFVAGVPGIVGDIETLGRAGLRAAGANVSPRSVTPTTERVGQALYGRPKTQEEQRFREAGALFSPVGTLPRALSRGFSGVAGRFIPKTTEPMERAAGTLERAGIKPEAQQLAASEPLRSPGALGARASNQDRVNRAATSAAGRETKYVDAEFLKERAKTLGSEYDRIYGQTVNLDARAKGALEQIRDAAAAIRPADAPELIRTANAVLDRFKPNTTSAQIAGKDLQALRSNLNQVAQRGGQEGYQAGQLVRAIDDIFIRGLPQAQQQATREALRVNNQRYSAFSALEEMARRGHTRGGNLDLMALGDYMATNAPRFVRGQATNPLAELALAGREAKLGGLGRGAEGAVRPEGGLTARALSALRTVPLRTTPARTMQRRRAAGEPMIPEPSGYPGGPVPGVAGAAGRETERR